MPMKKTIAGSKLAIGVWVLVMALTIVFPIFAREKQDAHQIPVVAIDGVQYTEESVMALQAERRTFFEQLLAAMQRDLKRAITSHFEFLLNNRTTINLAEYNSSASNLLDSYYRQIDSAELMYKASLLKKNFVGSQSKQIKSSGSFTDFFPPMTPPVVLIAGAYYDAYGVSVLQNAMGTVSNYLLTAMKREIEEVIHDQFNRRLNNIDPLLDWYWGFLTNYAKMVQDIKGTSEAYLEKKFLQYIEAGIDEEILTAKMQQDIEQMMGFGYAFASALLECTVYVEPVEDATVITGDAFLAPYTLPQKIDALGTSCGFSIPEGLLEKSNVKGQILSAAAMGGMAMSVPFNIKDAPKRIKELSKGIKWTNSIGTKLMGRMMNMPVFKNAIGKLAAKLSAKAVGGTVTKVGVPALLASILTGPWGPVIVVAGGVILDVTVDYFFNEWDEHKNRQPMKDEIAAAINSQRQDLLRQIQSVR